MSVDFSESGGSYLVAGGLLRGRMILFFFTVVIIITIIIFLIIIDVTDVGSIYLGVSFVFFKLKAGEDSIELPSRVGQYE